MGQITQIWRHPIKAYGREALIRAMLKRGRALPFDRQWAVPHAAAKLAETTADGWQHCRNLSRGAGVPLLQAMQTRMDVVTGTVTLIHPKIPGITFNPKFPADQERFINFVQRLTPIDRPQPTGIFNAINALTDSEAVSLSTINLASHDAICDQVGRPLSPLRWRGNLLLRGFEAWEERSWVGKKIRIGTAKFFIHKETTRCRMTEASTGTGQRDADTLGALRAGWDIQEMGVYAVVIKAGKITVDDEIEVLS